MATMGPCHLTLLLVGFASAREQAPIHARAVRPCACAAMSQPYFDTVIGDSTKGKFRTKHNTTQIKDFRLPQMMHTPLTIWTYNCQRMSNAHKKKLGPYARKAKSHMAGARNARNIFAQQRRKTTTKIVDRKLRHLGVKSIQKTRTSGPILQPSGGSRYLGTQRSFCNT